MDLRTIMNADAGASNRPPPSQSSSSPPEPPHQRVQQSYPKYPTRPSQPALHPQHASPDRSSSYGSAHSPYQQFNAGPPPLNTAVQSHRSQSPSHISTPYGSGGRDPYGASAYSAHPSQTPTGPLASPYTPQQPMSAQPMSAGPQPSEQQSYFAQQRSHSLQSVMTNPRAPSESFHIDSPKSTSQSLPPHQVSPSTQRSVAGTPLGPAPFPSRQSPTARPQSSGHDSPHLLSSPRPAPDVIRDSTQMQSPSLPRHFSPGPRPEQTPQFHANSLPRESVETASPKAASRQNSTAAPFDPIGRAQIRTSDDSKATESPTTVFGSGPDSDVRVSPVATTHAQMTSSPSGPRSGSHPLKMEVDQQSMSQESMPRAEIQPPKRKRRRYNEPPIYAQRSVRKGKCPIIPNPHPPIPKHARRADQEHWASRRRSSTAASAGPGSVTSRVARTPGAAPATNGPVPSLAPSAPSVGSLGPWEPSITGFVPYEEITKILCDFLFKNVVMRNDVAAGPAGSAAAGQGTIIEVEAKLGHIIDQDRRERLQLPVLTESVVNRENPHFRTSFESNMSIEQHRAMNNFLNEAVKASMSAPDSKRIPLAYAHKKERDTFYEVNPAELPPVIRQNLNPRHKPRVRVTTDQKTGEVLAKIIKCRVADIDVYSPRTTVDWRVSVNLEMEYEGDYRSLPIADAARGGRGERNKDRMSYRHLAYQVDLTQVASAEPPSKSDFEHELEIEVSAAEIRRQGQMAASGDPKHQYEELVKGFVDNIRVLARAVPP